MIGGGGVVVVGGEALRTCLKLLHSLDVAPRILLSLLLVLALFISLSQFSICQLTALLLLALIRKRNQQ